MFAHSPTATAEAVAASAPCGRPALGQAVAQHLRPRRGRRGRPRRRGRGPDAHQHSSRRSPSTPRRGHRCSGPAGEGSRATPCTRRAARRLRVPGGLPRLRHRRRRRRARRRGRGPHAARRGGRRRGRHGEPRRSPCRREGAGRARVVVRPARSRRVRELVGAANAGLEESRAPVSVRRRRPGRGASGSCSPSTSRAWTRRSSSPRRLRPWFATVKVGLELFSAEGPLAVDALLDEGFRVFLDLKLHDIPTTVARAARRIGSLGVWYRDRARGRRRRDAARSRGRLRGGMGDAPSRTATRPQDGLGRHLGGDGAHERGRGRVQSCSATRALLAARQRLSRCHLRRRRTSPSSARRAPSLLTVVPGIRLTGSSGDDQARVGDAGVRAFGAGADLLVVGRTVTAAEDPEAAAGALQRRSARRPRRPVRAPAEGHL